MVGGNSAHEPGAGKLLRQDEECPQFSAFLQGWETNNVVLTKGTSEVMLTGTWVVPMAATLLPQQ